MKRSICLRTFICPAIIVAFSFFFSGCSQSNEPVSKTGFYFDTVITITLHAYPGNDPKDLIEACFSLCDQYEKLFSRTIDGSDISNINKASENHMIKVAPETIELLALAKHFGELTHGAFDITAAPLSALWNITGKQPEVPSEVQIRNALRYIDYNNIVINEHNVSKKYNDTMIDAGGIAKGFIADKLKSYLNEKGVTGGIIDLGGDIMLIGEKPGRSDFNVGIQKPFGRGNETMLVVQANDYAVVTSGVYERYFEKDGRLYHHIFDTANGYPADNHLYSVTIIAANAADADALSTGCLVLGLEKGLSLIEDLDHVEAIFIDDNYNVTISSGLHLKDDIVTIK